MLLSLLNKLEASTWWEGKGHKDKGVRYFLTQSESNVLGIQFMRRYEEHENINVHQRSKYFTASSLKYIIENVDNHNITDFFSLKKIIFTNSSSVRYLHFIAAKQPRLYINLSIKIFNYTLI